MLKSRLVLLSLALTLGVAGPAHAYVDPGTGSLLIQILIGLAVGALFYFRLAREKIREFLGFKKPTVASGEGEEGAEDGERG